MPKPGGRHFPVFYEGPLEIEEIIISEAVSLDAMSDDATSRPTEPIQPNSPLSTSELRSSIPPTPARSPGLGRNRLLTAPAIIGLGAALVYASYQVATHDTLSNLVAEVRLTAPDQALKDADSSQRSDATDTVPPSEANDSIQTEFAHLAWVDAISTTHHERILTLIQTHPDPSPNP